MDQIRSWLYIGNYRDCLDHTYLHHKSIEAILQLAEEVDQTGITCLYIPVADIAPISHAHIRAGVDFVLGEKEKGKNILVACGSGINRSTAFCVAALHEVEGISLLDAYIDIKKKHRPSIPHEPVWESLCKYYKEDVPYIEIMRISAGYY